MGVRASHGKIFKAMTDSQHWNSYPACHTLPTGASIQGSKEYGPPGQKIQVSNSSLCIFPACSGKSTPYLCSFSTQPSIWRIIGAL